jgi:chemotaxis protein methyltransferase CheR
LPENVRALLRSTFEPAGLCEDLYQPSALLRRLPACLRALRAQSPEQGRALIEADPARRALAFETMLIGTTWFLRDPPVFEELNRILPSLAKRRRSLDGLQGTGLRVWSVGCSEGVELYSVAMLLSEAGMLDGGELLGSDCRPRAIERARQARYSANILHAMPPELRQKYFHEDGKSLVPRRELRDAVRWQVANVLRCEDVDAWDLVLCRNLAIYLSPAVAEDLWHRLARALRPGGLLVAGKAERPVVKGLRRIEPCIYLKG